MGILRFTDEISVAKNVKKKCTSSARKTVYQTLFLTAIIADTMQ